LPRQKPEKWSWTRRNRDPGDQSLKGWQNCDKWFWRLHAPTGTGNSTWAYRPEICESAGHLSRLPC